AIRETDGGSDAPNRRTLSDCRRTSSSVHCGRIYRRNGRHRAEERLDMREMRAPEWLIVGGATIFIFVLALSAVWEPDIRWLHFFQAWMYIATIALSLRHNRWGYFIGVSAAGLWAYTGLFVTSFVMSGIRHLMTLDRPDQIIAVPAWLSNV